MKILIYSTKDFEIPFLEEANATSGHIIHYISDRLTYQTAYQAIRYDAISIFSSDDASSQVLEKLNDFGVKYICLRSTGYDNVNLKTANRLGIRVANAAGYSPSSVAEHAVSLLMTLNRKIITAYDQTKENNFSLTNLIGFDLIGKTIGVIGTGRIGKSITRIMDGFGCTILANDLQEDLSISKEYNATYSSLDELIRKSDVIFLSLPLNSETYHLVDNQFLDKMKKTAILINVARGKVVDTQKVLDAVKSKKIAAYGADVYEKESGVFFYDYSKTEDTIDDPLLKKLIQHPNILLTPHQAFATKEALSDIARTTFENINCWSNDTSPKNELTSVLVN